MSEQPERQVQNQDVQQMFNSIAARYDLLNHMLSLGIDRLWRKRLVRLLAKDKPLKILDIACGTADLSIAASSIHPESITGIDIAENMLSIGRKKIQKKRLENIIKLSFADAENLPFQADSFDAIMVAFGVRNFNNLQKGLAEMHRVLKPGAKAFILEFSTPKRFPFRQLYMFYFFHLLPFIGKSVSKHNHAYTYLPASVLSFPKDENFTRIMLAAGFSQADYESLSFGITDLYIGIK